GGGPGVHSARFATGHPVERLLEALAGMEGDARRARYVCELVALDADGRELRGTGTLEGRIVTEPRGTEGFGYDPVFVPDGEERTVAELGDGWKTRNSHRARAAAALDAARYASPRACATGRRPNCSHQWTSAPRMIELAIR